VTISPDQFNPDDYKGWHTDQSNADKWRTYTYLDKNNRMNHHGLVEGQGIDILIRSQGEYPNFQMEYDRDGLSYMRTYPSPMDEGEPKELFTHYPAQVHSAFSSKGTRSQVLTGLALANEDAYPGGSRLMTYDHNLSTHSSKLVSNMRDRGLDIPTNEDNSEAEVTNSYGFKDHFTAKVNPNRDSPVPAHKVQAAKKLVRSILRPSGSGTTPSSPPSALPLSPIKDDAVRAGIAGGWVYPEHDEERKPPTPVPGQLSLF
jgi:hypothetical protein